MIKLPVSPLTYPAPLKQAFIFLLLGWFFHLGFLFIVFEGTVPERILWQQLVILGFQITFLLYLKNWARVLCVCCNILLILLYIMFLVAFYDAGKPTFSLMAMVVICCYSLSAHLFSKNETIHFFKTSHEKSNPT